MKSFNFFTSIFAYKDKQIRKRVFYNIVKNIKNLIKLKKFGKIETPLVNHIRKIISGSSVTIAKRILKLLMRIYYKRIWFSKKLINLIAFGINVKDQKVNLMVARFLISTAEQMFVEIDTEQEDEDLEALTK